MQAIQKRLYHIIARTLGFAACLISGIGFVIYSHHFASFILGAACHFIPHCLLALLTFRRVGAPHSNTIIRYFYLGEMSKFILIIGFMLLCYTLFAINITALVSGLLSSVLCCAIAPIFMDKQ